MNCYDNILFIEEIMSINMILKGDLKLVENAYIVVDDLKKLDLSITFQNCKFIFITKDIIKNMLIDKKFTNSINFICLLLTKEIKKIKDFWKSGECFKQNHLNIFRNDILEGKYSIYIPNLYVATSNIKIQDMGFNEFFQKNTNKKPTVQIENTNENIILYNQNSYQKRD